MQTCHKMTHTLKFQIVIIACAFSIFGQIFGQKHVIYVRFLYFMLNTDSTKWPKWEKAKCK